MMAVMEPYGFKLWSTQRERHDNDGRAPESDDRTPLSD